VRVAVAGDLMPRAEDAAHQVRLAFGQPTQDEKRGPDLMTRQHVQKAQGVVDDPHRQRFPLLAWHGGLPIVAVEPLFDIDRDDVFDLSQSRPPGGDPARRDRPRRA
jgi:hypothetical protein